jgi:hypothetical protein
MGREIIALMMEAASTYETVNFLPDYTALQPRRQPAIFIQRGLFMCARKPLRSCII